MIDSLEGLSFRAPFGVSGDALLLTDKLGCILGSNGAANQFFGCGAEELNGLMIDSLIPNYYRLKRYQDREQTNGHPKNRASDQGRVLIATRLDGTQRQITLNCSNLTDYVLIAFYDISERFSQNQRISENAETQRAIVEQAVVGIVQTDLQGNITLVNQCFCEITDYSQEKLLEMNLFGLIHIDDCPQHQTLFARLVNDNKPFTFEARYVRRNGDLAWVKISVSRISDANRQPSRCIAVVEDITERRLTARELQASEARLRLAERAANLGIFDIDLTDNSLQCNQRIFDIWGFNADEPLCCEQFLAGITRDNVPSKHLFSKESLDLNNSKEYQEEIRVIHRKNHTETWVSVSGRIFFEDDHAKRIVGIVQDISKRKRAERDRQKSSAAMGSLLKQQVAAQTASAIAHELNQPLAAISAYGEVACKILDSSPINVEQLNRALRGCTEQAQRAGRTLHALLNFLQQSEITYEPININALIEDTIAIAQNHGYGDFTTRLQLQQDLPLVSTNRLQTQMVLMNLIRNGVEAMRAASIALTSVCISIDTSIKNNMVLVTIQDRGPGLDTITAKRIFDPFFTTKPTGIGMGLAISRALIEANGGELWLDTNNLIGTVFHFTLPFES